MKLIWIKPTLIFTLLISISFACKQKETAQNIKPNTSKFFDLKGYFEEEAERLSSKNKFTKTVMVNGKSEARVIDTLDFKKELSFFADADINRPAWSDEYVVDTIFNDEREVLQLNYKQANQDENLKIQNIEIGFSKGIVNKVLVENNTSNSLTKSNQVLTYQPDYGYSIESHQRVSIGEEQLFKVEVSF